MSSSFLRISANWNHNVFWEHGTVSLGSILRVFLELALEKKKPRWVNILSPLGQTPQRTAFLKPRRSRSAARAFGRACWFHLLWHGGRWGQYAVLCCAVQSVWNAVVVFVQRKKRRQNWLIPTTSCLWRQEEVTVAILFLTARAWMSAGLHVALDTSGYTNLLFWGFILETQVVDFDKQSNWNI